MSDLSGLDPTEQVERLTRLATAALVAWGIEGAEVTLVKHRENAVFSVSRTGARYALRIHRAGYHTDDEIRSELQWITALDASGFRTPQVVPTLDGSLFTHASTDEVPGARQVDLLEWFEGVPIGSAGVGLEPDADTASTYRLVGSLMALTHEHGVRWTPPADFTRHAWDEDGILGDDPFWGPYWSLAELDDTQRARLTALRPVALAELAEFGKGPDRYGLIHADFLPENLLRHGEDICLIDFDDAGYGWHLFDVATTLFFDRGEAHYDEAFDALVDGYRSHRPLPDEHLAHLPLFFVLRGLTYLGWAHTRSDTETAQIMAPFIASGVDDLVREFLDRR